MRYTTWGRVRGDCGHVHATADAAYRCCCRDRAGCRQQGGYSDRHIRVIQDRRDILSYETAHGPGRRLAEMSAAEERHYQGLRP